MKPEAMNCVSECPQTRNMAIGMGALWLLACKVCAPGLHSSCPKIRRFHPSVRHTQNVATSGADLKSKEAKLEVAKAA
jgi:hypothetical protein